MARRIKVNDMVKIITGDKKIKGKVARVTKVLADKNQVLLEGIGNRTRHVAKSYYNPVGGKRDIQVPIAISNVALVIDEKAGKTSRVGYKVVDGKKVRCARQAKDKVIKDGVKPAKTAKKGAK